ncbi:unnamed protein product [Paramecium pentaurelia]|uniref:Uncharacterized protein n=1 Tax=Paramecium pentaurelia TaxID=43138 RepID=A0A8S1SSV5_9CILI|nr:unnamed protein product [Paramecium pentaurelia]
MIIFYLIALVQGLIPDNCKWTDPDGFHFDINHLKRKDNYKVTSFSGAMSFEFNFCTYGVQCNHREVKKVEYQGLLRFNYFIINVTQQAQNLNQIYGDLCGETLQYSVQFQIQCGEEAPFKQIMTDSPCNIMLQTTHPMACRKQESYFYYYLFSIVFIAAGLFLMKRKKKQEQGYVLV